MGNRPPNRRGHGGTRPHGGPDYGSRTRGTKHGGKGRSAGGGQSRPPEKSCRDNMIAVPVTIVKLLFGWRPDGYKVADVPWGWQS